MRLQITLKKKQLMGEGGGKLNYYQKIFTENSEREHKKRTYVAKEFYISLTSSFTLHSVTLVGSRANER